MFKTYTGIVEKEYWFNINQFVSDKGLGSPKREDNKQKIRDMEMSARRSVKS